MIEASQKDHVLFLTINRPEVLNALNKEVMHRLQESLIQAESDESVKVIVITGKGKAFVAGADINEFLSLKDAEEGREYSLLGQNVFSSISKLAKPVICAINGYALGGGLELALACDIRIASENAKLGLPEIKLGLFPGYGGAQRLPRLVGKGMGLYMMLSGEMFSAQEAEKWGLIEQIVPQGELLDFVNDFAQKISKFPLGALTALKSSVNNGLEMHIDDALHADAKRIGELMVSDEAQERALQFVSKRT
ncbi:enoyl-CoA hydratase/isomerase family protein [Neobacillus drentensis]|uniref:enoyl-CoA hydratase/isomerase family protein n=1 Tax=Neobacillus drentensis TaxID=220684 RepID=UPI000825A8E6|nr:enoyl-CoA hydratase/isomerase family protein [Neobacillus drentensis]